MTATVQSVIDFLTDRASSSTALTSDQALVSDHFGLRPTKLIPTKARSSINMTFVNEYISPEDRIKYDIDRINSQYVCAGISEQWTIDRDRNIYLRDISYGAGHSKKRVWHFFWRGHLIELSFEILGRSGSGRGGEHWVHKKITNFQLPAALLDKQDEILADLKEALLCYKDGGVYSTSSVYNLTLDF